METDFLEAVRVGEALRVAVFRLDAVPVEDLRAAGFELDAFLRAVFFIAAFFIAAFFTVAFFTVAFFTVAFLMAVFLTAVFLVAAFFAVAFPVDVLRVAGFLAGAFFTAAFRAGAFCLPAPGFVVRAGVDFFTDAFPPVDFFAAVFFTLACLRVGPEVAAFLVAFPESARLPDADFLATVLPVGRDRAAAVDERLLLAFLRAAVVVLRALLEALRVDFAMLPHHCRSAAGCYSLDRTDQQPSAHPLQAALGSNTGTRRDPHHPFSSWPVQAPDQSIARPALPVPSQLLRLCAHRRGSIWSLAWQHTGLLAHPALPTALCRWYRPGARTVSSEPLPCT